MLLQQLPLEVLPPRAALLAAEVMLVCMPAGSDLDLARCRAAPPYGTVDVTLGGVAHRIAAVRRRDPEPIPRSNCPSMQKTTANPRRGRPRIAEELDEASQRRLLAFLLGFCRKAFSLADDRQFAATCLRLAQLCVPQEGVGQPVATATPAGWCSPACRRRPTRPSSSSAPAGSGKLVLAPRRTFLPCSSRTRLPRKRAPRSLGTTPPLDCARCQRRPARRRPRYRA